MRLLLALLLSCAHAVSFAQPTTMITGPLPETEHGRYVGCDRSFYYSLHVDGKKKDRAATVIARDIKTLEKDHAFQIVVPAESAEEFSVQGFIVSDAAMHLFYSFYLKNEDQMVLAVAELDKVSGTVSNTRKLMSMPSSTEVRAGTFFIKHHEHSGLTTILYTRPSAAPYGEVAPTVVPEFPVIVLDAQLNVVHSGQGKMSDYKNNYADFENALFSESGDVYFLASLGVGGLKMGSFLISYDHRTGEMHKAAVPDLSDEKQWDYKRTSSFFRETPSGAVYFFWPFCLNSDQFNIGGISVASFDKENCMMTGWKEYFVTKRDLANFDKAKQPPVLFNMEIVDAWWKNNEELVLGMRRVEYSSTGKHTRFDHIGVMTWTAEGGLSESHFLNRDCTVVAEERGQSTVAVLKDPKEKDGAFVIFEELPANVGLGENATPTEWESNGVRKEGLTPVWSEFDGSTFTPRAALIGKPIVPAPEMWLWATFETKNLYIFSLRTEDNVYYMTVQL